MIDWSCTIESAIGWDHEEVSQMDVWHDLVVLVALIAILKWYIWCQMRYWYSPKYKEDWERHKKRPKRTDSATEDKEE